MERKEDLQEKTKKVNKDMQNHLRKIVESLEIGNGCEESECFSINSSTKSFVQACEEMLELINMIKIKVIVSTATAPEEDFVKEARKKLCDLKKANVKKS
jgi:ERCC4-type nuclease